MNDFLSWGRFPRVTQTVRELKWRSDPVSFEGSPVLPYGLGRSYGDVCLNADHVLLNTARLRSVIAFDVATGIVRAEAGLSLGELLGIVVPKRWFLPVSPGTRFVTLGGAVANDVHGKNHHRAGTIGSHIRAFELLRSNGDRVICTMTDNAELFQATIGGLGLTGLITWVELQLKPIESPYIAEESIRFGSLERFFEISAESDSEFEYTVAWLDCLKADGGFGRGMFFRGNHLAAENSRGGTVPPCEAERAPARSLLSVPFDFPGWVLNRGTIRLFNALYYHRQQVEKKFRIVHYRPFFYPLDSIEHWNRIYGRRGLLQFQCVVPGSDRRERIAELLRVIVRSKQASFLAVLKEFGEHPSPGMLSFPRVGTTLSLDFAHRGQVTLDLLRTLDDMTAACGGSVYPAKDAIMSARHFEAYFPRLAEFVPHVDPKFSSSFWRRMGHGPVA